MKTKLFSMALLLLLCLGSCDLGRLPLTSFSEDSFFKDETNLQLAVTSLYRGDILYNGPEYAPNDWWGDAATIYLDDVTDIGYDRRGFKNDIGRLTSGDILNINKCVTNLWQQPYKRIAACNTFLQNVKKISSSPALERMKAEARFIRAVQYFYIASYYGNSPLVTEVLTQEEANTVSKSQKKDLIDFVVAELGEVAQILPHTKDIPSTEIGRASAQAALAIQARMLLFDKQYDLAAQALKQIMDWGENEIANDYSALFTTNENSTENIFSVQYIDNVAGHGLAQQALPCENLGWALVCPTANLFESYDFIDGSEFSYDNPMFDKKDFGKNRDPRLSATIIYNGAPFMGTIYDCHPEHNTLDKIGRKGATMTGFLMRKYFTDNKIQNLNSYGSNIPIVRFADVLLMYLEAKIESGAVIDQSLLDATINRIRGRASVNMPPITETSHDKLREILRKERKIELAFEGHRLWDLIRWGIAEEELNKPIYGSTFEVSDPKVIRKNGKKPDKHNRWYVNTRAFKPGQEVWPIPQAEININPNLQ